MRADFNRYLIRDGTVAGYAIFEPGGDAPELLAASHATRRTGLSYSLLPMTRSIIAGLFTPEQAQHHLRLIREHLLFPDGVRLMDRPVAYHGGPEQSSAAPSPRRSSDAKSASCMSTRICATRKRWPSSAKRTHSGTRC